MRSPSFIAFGLSLLLLFSGCGQDDSGANACIDTGEASGAIFIEVGCGDPKTRPIYIWDEGGAFEVKVTRVLNEALAWRIYVPTLEDSITSPVEHGESRSGTLSDGDETQLTPGIEYEVKVSRISGAPGSRKFTIQ